MYYMTFDENGIPVHTTNMKPENLDGYYEVEDDLMHNSLILDSGVIRKLTEEEIIEDQLKVEREFISNSVKVKRNLLLAEADVLTQADRWDSYNTKTKKLISEYKQLLRDIPLQEGFPLDVIFPVYPQL